MNNFLIALLIFFIVILLIFLGFIFYKLSKPYRIKRGEASLYQMGQVGLLKVIIPNLFSWEE